MSDKGHSRIPCCCSKKCPVVSLKLRSISSNTAKRSMDMGEKKKRNHILMQLGSLVRRAESARARARAPAHPPPPARRPCPSATSAACCAGGPASLPLPALGGRSSAGCTGVHVSSGANRARGRRAAATGRTTAGTGTRVRLRTTPKRSATRPRCASRGGCAGPASPCGLHRRSAAAGRRFRGRPGTAYGDSGGGGSQQGEAFLTFLSCATRK